jgi:hypothetical protein
VRNATHGDSLPQGRNLAAPLTTASRKERDAAPLTAAQRARAVLARLSHREVVYLRRLALVRRERQSILAQLERAGGSAC